jgi:hypothetical protein
VKVAGQWRYVYRAVDQSGQVDAWWDAATFTESRVRRCSERSRQPRGRPTGGSSTGSLERYRTGQQPNDLCIPYYLELQQHRFDNN